MSFISKSKETVLVIFLFIVVINFNISCVSSKNLTTKTLNEPNSIINVNDMNIPEQSTYKEYNNNLETIIKSKVKNLEEIIDSHINKKQMANKSENYLINPLSKRTTSEYNKDPAEDLLINTEENKNTSVLNDFINITNKLENYLINPLSKRTTSEYNKDPAKDLLINTEENKNTSELNDFINITDKSSNENFTTYSNTQSSNDFNTSIGKDITNNKLYETDTSKSIKHNPFLLIISSITVLIFAGIITIKHTYNKKKNLITGNNNTITMHQKTF